MPRRTGWPMSELWFALLCFMLTMFVVLDGWDIGAGTLHLLVAKNHNERRTVIAAIGPLWTWHEVWLVAAGGTFLLAFPAVMAAAFSGFYLALWLLLWALLLRGISIEAGGHIRDAMWETWWDFVFAASNLLLAVLLGAALGNVIRGVPVDASGRFSLALFTDLGARGRIGLLDWFTLSVGAFAALILAAHGATYLTLKTEGAVHERSQRLGRRLWVAVAAAFPIISAMTATVRPGLFQAISVRPFALLAA